MTSYEKVLEYIGNNLNEFVEHFFPEQKVIRGHSGIKLNPAPCCGHNDCFSISKRKPVYYCFSCGTKGNYIQLVAEEPEGKKELERWSGIKINPVLLSEEQKNALDKFEKQQFAIKYAIDFYHEQLFQNKEAYEKQTLPKIHGGRSHSIDALKKFKVGLSGNFIELYKQLTTQHGYTQEELAELQRFIWIPEGMFVYPYYDLKGNVVRINTKMWFRSCKRKQMLDGSWAHGSCLVNLFDLSKEAKEKHEQETGHTMTNNGYSAGEKSWFWLPSESNRQKLIIVEGENDAISVWEALQALPKVYRQEFTVAAIGGKTDEHMMREPFLRKFQAVYEAFDNDDAGDGYRRELDEKVPDIPVYRIAYDSDFNDIDDWLKSPSTPFEDFKIALDKAEFVDVKDKHVIERDGHHHIWWLKTRRYELKFVMDGWNKSMDQAEGTLFIYKQKQLVDKKTGGIDKISIDQSMKATKVALSQHIETYYNDIRWQKQAPNRDFFELKDILRFTKEQAMCIKHIAWHIFHSEKDEYARKVKYIQDKLSQQMVAEILKEVNGFQNQTIDPHQSFPRITLSQFFSVSNDDGFIYFSKMVKEGDIAKIVPCLLTNKREEVRLDLLKRKDPQCLLLISNKYELSQEVPTAVMDPREVSLQPYWAELWKNDQIPTKDLEPATLVAEIEAFIRRCYFATDEVIKVLSLWIYATYFYMLFKSGFPYLIFNGPKGSGKSTFDAIIYLLAFNPKFALDMSEASLYRTISFEGGTFILDEIEDLVDKRTVNSSGYAKILKGGYADLAYVYRVNMDKGVSERFSVFGPKVISNINGIEDVIGDRCIYVRTIPAPEPELAKLEDPQLYKEERRDVVHSISSRCALSALMYFQKVHEIFASTNSRLSTGNARLTQILRPLLTLAQLVGGDYQKNLMAFYEKEIKTTKDEIQANTIEGMIHTVLKRIAEEVVDIEAEKWATNPEKHVYQTPINFSINSGMFEVDTIHIKVLVEEINQGDAVNLKTINAALKHILGSKFDYKANRRQTTATIEDFGLQKQLGEKKYVRTYRYYLNVYQFIQRQAKTTMKAESSLF